MYSICIESECNVHEYTRAARSLEAPCLGVALPAASQHKPPAIAGGQPRGAGQGNRVEAEHFDNKVQERQAEHRHRINLTSTRDRRMLGKLGQLCCVSSTDDGGIGRVLFEIDRSHANPAKPERPRPNEAEFGQSWAELDHVWVKLASAGLNSAHSGRHRASPERFRPIVGELGRFRDGFGRSARSTRHRPGPEMDPTLTPLRPPIGPQHRPASDVPQMFSTLR